MKRPLVVLCAAAAVAALAACGGNASNFVGPSPSASPSHSPATGTVAFDISIPTASTTDRRHPQFAAPPGTQSVSIALTSSNGALVSATPTVANLTGSTSGCSSSKSALTCTIDVSVPAGNDVFRVSVFSQQNAQGTPLGVGNVSVAAQAGATTNAPATLNGTIASVALSLPQSIPEGQSGSVPLVIEAKDANGNVILGSYTAPIVLSITDASKHTSLSSSSVADSTTASSVRIAYDGGAMAAGAKISASVTGAGLPDSSGVVFMPDAHYPTTGSFTVATLDVFPGQSPAPPSSSQMSYKNGASFNGVNGLIDATTVNGSDISDAYYLWQLAANDYQFEYVGFSDNTIGQVTEICQPPYAVLYASNATTWGGITGSGPCTQTNVDSFPGSPFTNTQTMNADGSYNGTFTDTSPSETQYFAVNKDGTAVRYAAQSGRWSVTAIYTPAPNSSTIPVYAYATTGPLPSPLPSPSPANTTEPNFYATAGFANGQPPQPLKQDAFTKVGVAALPSSCLVPQAVLGSNPQITEYDESYVDADPLNAASMFQTKNYALNGIGVVCAVTTWVEGDPFSANASTTTEIQYVTASSLQAMVRGGTPFAQAMPAAGLALATDAIRLHENVLRLHQPKGHTVR